VSCFRSKFRRKALGATRVPNLVKWGCLRVPFDRKSVHKALEAPFACGVLARWDCARSLRKNVVLLGAQAPWGGQLPSTMGQRYVYVAT
jgi:hypothetical protein